MIGTAAGCPVWRRAETMAFALCASHLLSEMDGEQDFPESLRLGGAFLSLSPLPASPPLPCCQIKMTRSNAGVFVSALRLYPGQYQVGGAWTTSRWALYTTPARGWELQSIA